MECNIELHEGFIEFGDESCPICKTLLVQPQETKAKIDYCCDCQDIINNDGMIVCQNCGVVKGYKMAREYVNFYDNIYRIKRKSIYHRKYHLCNILMDIGIKQNMFFLLSKKIRF